VNELERFATLAGRYCEAIETPRNLDLLALSALLAELYVAARHLPSHWQTDDEADTREPEIDIDKWSAITQPLARSSSELEYRSVEIELDVKPDPYVATLSVDLADIWDNLKSGLLAFERGDRDAALWSWGFGFEDHWGRHAVEALRAIHYLAPRR
jgi:hypothetical protein